MIDLKKEIGRLEKSLAELYASLAYIPAPLKTGATARELSALIESIEKKVALLKESERKFW